MGGCERTRSFAGLAANHTWDGRTGEEQAAIDRILAKSGGAATRMRPRGTEIDDGPK
jgi:hypothetical protein